MGKILLVSEGTRRKRSEKQSFPRPQHGLVSSGFTASAKRELGPSVRFAKIRPLTFPPTGCRNYKVLELGEKQIGYALHKKAHLFPESMS